jgi:hypothetical protein
MLSDLLLSIIIAGNAMLMVEGDTKTLIGKGSYIFLMTLVILYIRRMLRGIWKDVVSIDETLKNLKK